MRERERGGEKKRDMNEGKKKIGIEKERERDGERKKEKREIKRELREIIKKE